MRYSNGNYEAFARPRKPKNVDQKSAYIKRILLEEGWPDWRPLFSWCVMDKCPGKKFIYI